MFIKYKPVITLWELLTHNIIVFPNRYVELLIQKMAFNLDLNFLFAVLSLFTGCIKKENYSEVGKFVCLRVCLINHCGSQLQLNEQDRDILKLHLQHVVHSEVNISE